MAKKTQRSPRNLRRDLRHKKEADYEKLSFYCPPDLAGEVRREVAKGGKSKSDEIIDLLRAGLRSRRVVNDNVRRAADQLRECVYGKEISRIRGYLRQSKSGTAVTVAQICNLLGVDRADPKLLYDGLDLIAACLRVMQRRLEIEFVSDSGEVDPQDPPLQPREELTARKVRPGGSAPADR
jgi:hypothetical protein